jgi:hypothetical protein
MKVQIFYITVGCVSYDSVPFVYQGSHYRQDHLALSSYRKVRGPRHLVLRTGRGENPPKALAR